MRYFVLVVDDDALMQLDNASAVAERLLDRVKEALRNEGLDGYVEVENIQPYELPSHVTEREFRF